MRGSSGIPRALAGAVVAVVALAALVSAMAAQAQAAGLPRTYNAQRIDSPTPVGGGAFGWGIWSADLTGDFKQDLIVAQAQVGTQDEPNKVFIFDGDNGSVVDTIVPPEDNPLEPNFPPGFNPETTTVPPGTEYRSPEMAFVYVETMPDIGSCPGGDGPDADKICDRPTVEGEDGIPEILVGSRALRVNPTDGSQPPTLADPLAGRGYVLDGRTRAVLKRIDMPVADRQALLARSSKRSFTIPGTAPGTTRTATVNIPTTTAAFGRTMASPQGMPPCAGLRSENNDTGVGPCPPTPQAVRIGDLDGGGKADIVITARGFPETSDVIRNDNTRIAGSAPAGSHCRLTAPRQADATAANPNPPVPSATICSAGKAWTYRGEDIAGSNPRAILDVAMNPPCVSPGQPANCTPTGGIQNPDAQASPAGGEWGGNLFRVGDVVGNDGIPDFVIPFRGADFPLRGTPDLNAGLNMGSAYAFNGRSGALGRTIVSPEPQIRSQFSGNFNAGRAVGDLGATTTADILLPAALQNVAYADQGRLWVFNGDLTAGGGGEQSWNFTMLNDPEPYIGGTFGGGMTGVGDVVDGPEAPANEVLVGGFRFDTFTEASQNVVADVNFMNATLDKNLMTIPNPEGARGDGFGVGITPMGDLNGDGFVDFAVSSYLADGPLGGQGRAWIFRSDNSPAPGPPAVAPATATPTPGSGAPRAAALRPGRCANRMLGTDAAEKLDGTLAGDQIFAFAGADTVDGFQGQDCIDGARGNDTVDGGDDSDKLIGGSGADRLRGQGGNDKLFGGSGGDLLDGGPGRNMLAGGSGNDRLLGGRDADELFGEAGKDRIIAGTGRNRIDGGDGNDSIDARNGAVDTILCGKGRDRVQVDRNDKLSSCERVSFAKSGKAKS